MISDAPVPQDIHRLIEELSHWLTGMPEVTDRDGEVWWRVLCAPGVTAYTAIHEVRRARKPAASGTPPPRHNVAGMPGPQTPVRNMPSAPRQQAFPRSAVADPTSIWLRPATRREKDERGIA